MFCIWESAHRLDCGICKERLPNWDLCTWGAKEYGLHWPECEWCRLTRKEAKKRSQKKYSQSVQGKAARKRANTRYRAKVAGVELHTV